MDFQDIFWENSKFGFQSGIVQFGKFFYHCNVNILYHPLKIRNIGK